MCKDFYSLMTKFHRNRLLNAHRIINYPGNDSPQAQPVKPFHRSHPLFELFADHIHL